MKNEISASLGRYWMEGERQARRVLFVDGHVKHFNLKKHLQLNWQYPAEPTPDRIWYKAKE